MLSNTAIQAILFVGYALSIAGLGAAVEWLWRRRLGSNAAPASLGDCGLLGLFTLAALGLALHFFFPLSPWLGLSVVLLGAVSLLVFRRRVQESLRRIDVLFFLLCAATFYLQARVDTINSDAPVYYIPTILWNSEYPLIPGLANLHGRLAFNNAGLVIAALLRSPFAPWGQAFLLNSFFALFVMSAFFQRTRIALETSPPTRPSTIYALLILAGFCAKNFIFNGVLGGLGTDFPPLILACYIGYLLLAAAEEKDFNGTGWAALLACLAVLLKLSALPLLIGAGVFLIASEGALREKWRATATYVLIMALFLTTWSARDLFLSGCAAYPLGATCLSWIPWTVPAELAINESQYILDYARNSIVDPKSLAEWISPFVRELVANHIGKLLLAVGISGLLILFVSRFRRVRTPSSSSAPAAVGVIAIGLCWMIFAIFKGPALRFYMGGAFMISYTILALGLSRVGDLLPILQLKRFSPIVICALLTLQFGLLGVRFAKSPHSITWPQFERADVSERTTDSGLTLRIANTENCWDSPLPCSPYFDPTLKQIPFLDRFYFRGSNTVAYRNGFPPRPKRARVELQ